MRSGTDIGRNAETFERLARDAVKAGATYLQTPEMTGILQRNPKLLFESITSTDRDPVLARASVLAKELGVWIHIGSTAVFEGDERDGKPRAKNRAGLFAPSGEIVAIYDKIHMFDVDLDNGERWRESNVYEPGKKAVLTGVAGVKTGISICYDMRFPGLYRQQAQLGALMLTAPSSFTKQTGQAHWHALLRARAIENGAFMVAAAQGGKHEDGRETYGHSLIVNPWGEIIAELDHDEPGFVLAELDFEECIAARGKIPNLANERSYVLEELSVPDNADHGVAA